MAIRNALIASIAVAALCAGSFGLGIAHNERDHAKKVSDAAQTAQQAANTEAAYSAQSSAHVDATAAASTSSINTIKDAVVAHLEQTQPKVQVIYRDRPNTCNGSEPNLPKPAQGLHEGAESAGAGSNWTFDRGTVGMLNAARLGLSIEPTTIGNAEGNAPSAVGIPEFVGNDLAVVARYHALKIKHDALVDYLERLQAKGYGLCVAPENTRPEMPLDDP